MLCAPRITQTCTARCGRSTYQRAYRSCTRPARQRTLQQVLVRCLPSEDDPTLHSTAVDGNGDQLPPVDGAPPTTDLEKLLASVPRGWVLGMHADGTTYTYNPLDPSTYPPVSDIRADGSTAPAAGEPPAAPETVDASPTSSYDKFEDYDATPVVEDPSAVDNNTPAPDQPIAIEPPADPFTSVDGSAGFAAEGEVVPSDAPAPADPKPAFNPMPYVPSGAPETTWYCWPEGFIGQSFSLADELDQRASPLLEDVDKLYEFVARRREMCRYSEHTIDSAESASQMVQAVVGGAVDMGLGSASGSASFQMSRDFSSRNVSHSIVASFQENELLEMVRPSLSPAAKDLLTLLGPRAFAARYGTHFVSGVGHRGAFIGSITVKLADVKEAVGASASFKGSYGKVSGMADLKAEMSNTLSTSDVTFTWHKWGVADDSNCDALENYCASEDARFAAMRALAMHTADSAKGYPKLIKLRPYSTLPDYVEACSRYCAENRQEPNVELEDLEQALSYLTKQYRKASYIMQVIDNDRRLSVLNSLSSWEQQKASLAYKVKTLIKLMEKVMRSKDDPVPKAWEATPNDAPPSLYLLRTYFKYDSTVRQWAVASRSIPANHQVAFDLGKYLKTSLDEVDLLDYELFIEVQRPVVAVPRTDLLPEGQQNADKDAEINQLEEELGSVRLELETEQRVSDERAQEIERLLEEGEDTQAVRMEELDAARVAERNAVLKANLLESELEYYKAPKFIEMDTEKLVQMNAEVADLKALYEEELTARVEKLLMKDTKKSVRYTLPECNVCYDDCMCVDTVLPCGHMFCSRCASKLVECPMCRTVVTHTTFLFGIERSS